MSQLTDILEKQKVLILDGALGTQLQKNGYDVNDSLWSAKFLSENTEAIKQVHLEYLEAGADCIITSSYQASFEGFMKKGFSQEEAKKLIELSIEIAKDVRDDFWGNLENKNNRIKPLIAASIGPYGAFLADGSEYTGNYGISKKELTNFHKKRLDIIVNKNPDILACETMPSLEEVKILSELLKEYKELDSWITFSAKDGSVTNANDDIVQCASWLNEQKDITAIGINCTAPQFISSLIEKIKSVCNKPIVVYPNGGSAYNPITKIWEKSDTNPSEFAKMSHLWQNQGASLIGGCCETGPKEIKAIREILLP
jgi:homocysteine S-methyltransferase